jgi:hypothetical protein
LVHQICVSFSTGNYVAQILICIDVADNYYRGLKFMPRGINGRLEA